MRSFTFLKCLLPGIAVFIHQPFGYSQETTLPLTNSSYFENLVLSTDRELYITGEKVWFKVDCFDNDGLTEIIISKIVYVELYDQHLNTIAKGKFRIIDGTSTGFLNIPSTINSGNYYLRAYTQLLKNYSPYLYSSALLSIINPNKPVAEDENSDSEDILIVPDGGKLISGIPSKLAVRINSKLNRRITRSVIIGTDEKELITLTPSANGLAMFEIMPDSTIRYSLQITLDDGNVVLKPLPAILQHGMVLHSSYADSKLKVSLRSNTESGNGIKTDYRVEIKSATYKNLFVKIIQPNGSFEISGNQLTEGIVYILLKDKDNEIIDICSRYIPKVQNEEIEIKKNKDVFSPRELVNLDLKLPGDHSKKNHFVITVAKAGTNYDIKNLLPAHIAYNPVLLSNYLKTSAIKNDSLKNQIDIVLILYSALYNDKLFIEGLQRDTAINWLPEIRDVSISGKVIDKNTKRPLKDVMVYAAVFVDNNQLHIYKTNADGEFLFTLNHLTDIQHVFICAKPTDTLEMEILINNDFSNEYPPAAGLIPMDLDSSNHELLEQLYINAQVSRAFISHAEKTEEDISYYPLVMKEQEISVSLKDFIEIPVMSEIFNEIIPFVSIRDRNDQYYLSVFDDKNNVAYQEPMVLLDGIPIFDINQIMKISPELVDKIDVTNRLCYLGDYTLEGIISIKTNTGNFAGISFPDESEFIEYQTVSAESHPVFPNHDSSTQKDRNPDFRNLLYWDPYLLSHNGSKNVKFYASDHCGNYEIIVRGFDGLTHYHGTEILEVEK